MNGILHVRVVGAKVTELSAANRERVLVGEVWEARSRLSVCLVVRVTFVIRCKGSDKLWSRV